MKKLKIAVARVFDTHTKENLNQGDIIERSEDRAEAFLKGKYAVEVIEDKEAPKKSKKTKK